MFGSKISIALAATALLVSVLFATPLGQAAGSLVLAKNSVGTAQLKKDAVTGPKVKNGSLLAADFKAGQLPAGPQGPKGEKGDKGDPGAQGSTGPAGISGYHEVSAHSPTALAPGQSGEVNVSCPQGEKALSGEFSASAGAYMAPDAFQADANGAGWYIEAKNVGAVSGQLAVTAICAAVG